MSATPTAPALDANRVADLRALGGPDMPELADEVARIFVDASREGMANLVAAAEEEDAPAVANEAHRLKGSCGNLGALILERLCASIEDRIRGQGPIPLDTVLDAERELDRVLVAMQQEFDLAA